MAERSLCIWDSSQVPSHEKIFIVSTAAASSYTWFSVVRWQTCSIPGNMRMASWVSHGLPAPLVNIIFCLSLMSTCFYSTVELRKN